MLEFYQAYSDYQDLMVLTEELILQIGRQATGSDEIVYGQHRISLRPPYARLSLREAVCNAASARLGVSVSHREVRSRESAVALAEKLGIEVPLSGSAGKITQKLFEALCEGVLVQPTFVYDFPTELSPLSKQKVNDPETVERFELFHWWTGGGECVQRAERSGRTVCSVSKRRHVSDSGEISKRTRWTRTTCTRSSMVCRRRRVRVVGIDRPGDVVDR